MKKYVELAKKWLANNDSVSLEELNANEEAAWAAYASWADDARAALAAYWAAKAASWADDARAAYDAKNDARVEYCKQKAIKAIKEYEELTNEPTH